MSYEIVEKFKDVDLTVDEIAIRARYRIVTNGVRYVLQFWKRVFRLWGMQVTVDRWADAYTYDCDCGCCYYRYDDESSAKNTMEQWVQCDIRSARARLTGSRGWVVVK